MNELKVNGQTLSIEQELQCVKAIKHGGVHARRKAVKMLAQAYMPIASYAAKQIHACLVFPNESSVEELIYLTQQLTKVAVKTLGSTIWRDDARNFRECFVEDLLYRVCLRLISIGIPFSRSKLIPREKQRCTEHDLKMIVFKNFELLETIWMIQEKQVKAVNHFLDNLYNLQAA